MGEQKRFLLSNKNLQIPFPNILFLEWLEKWHADAKRRDLQSQYCYSKAIDSLMRYPLPMESPREATILKSVGPGIAEKLEKCWKKYIQEHPNLIPLPKLFPETSVTNENNPTIPSKTTTTSKKNYIPKYKSMGYGVILALLCNTTLDIETNRRTDLNRAEILMYGQQFGDMTPTKFQITINTLMKKNLIEIIADRMVRYMLTDSGVKLAEKLLQAHAQLCSQLGPDLNLESSDRQIQSQHPTSNLNFALNNDNQMYTLSQGSFEVVLLIDQIELNNNPQILSLFANRIKYEVRKLNIGDYIWIAKSKISSLEIVLDCLVERKTISDLSSSIIDGRFHEQKCRITHSSNIRKAIYLIEGNLGSNQSGILPETNLLQALSNTIVRSSFLVKHTKSFTDTVTYLVNMTKYLESKYENEDIEASIDIGANKLIPFNVFNDQSQKTKLLTNKEMMMALLMQIKGVSFEKALAVANLYPTFSELYQAFSNYTAPEPTKKKRKSKKIINNGIPININTKPLLLADVQLQNGKKLGKAVSEYIYEIMY